MEKLKQYVSEREFEIEKVASIRFDESVNTKRDDLRDDADIDYARVLYSSSFIVYTKMALYHITVLLLLQIIGVLFLKH